MSVVVFVDIKSYYSCDKDLEVCYHIPSTIVPNKEHYVALCEASLNKELGEQFSWVFAPATVPLEASRNGLTVEWSKGKAVFKSSVIPKFSDGRAYQFAYCDKQGAALGISRAFQFCTDAEEFSSIDLESFPSDDVVMVRLHRNKSPDTSIAAAAAGSLGGDSFEVVSDEQVTKSSPPAMKANVNVLATTNGDDEKTTCVVLGYENHESSSTPVLSTGYANGQNSILTSDTYDDIRTKSAESALTLGDVSMSCSNSSEMAEVGRQQGKVETLEKRIKELETETELLKEQISVYTSSSQGSKDDREKRILNKRIMEEKKKGERLEMQLTTLTEKYDLLEKESTTLRSELSDVTMGCNHLENTLMKVEMEKQKLSKDLEELKSKENSGPLKNTKRHEMESANVQQDGLSVEEIGILEMPIDKEYKAKMFVSLFKQVPFVCGICQQILPAHTEQYAQLNHIELCKKTPN